MLLPNPLNDGRALIERSLTTRIRRFWWWPIRRVFQPGLVRSHYVVVLRTVERTRNLTPISTSAPCFLRPHGLVKHDAEDLGGVQGVLSNPFWIEAATVRLELLGLGVVGEDRTLTPTTIQHLEQGGDGVGASLGRRIVPRRPFDVYRLHRLHSRRSQRRLGTKRRRSGCRPTRTADGTTTQHGVDCCCLVVVVDCC
jgi:hypothetical protein